MTVNLPLSQYLQLRKKYKPEVLKKILLAMQNRGDLLKKYVSAHLTLDNWASREDPAPPAIPAGKSINELLKSVS